MRSNLRINDNGKRYSFKDSALYNLYSEQRMKDILYINMDKSLLLDSNYLVFKTYSSGKKRSVQCPKPLLDECHTRLASLLTRLRVPEYLHSGIKGKSNVTNAMVHLNSQYVLTVDIYRFFPSIKKCKIYDFFKCKLRSSHDNAEFISEVCTYNDHIPTGSRISMLVAFWSCYGMFNDLDNLSKSRGVLMSVYVDDITFSGNVDHKFHLKVMEIVQSYGLLLNNKKTKIYKPHQPKEITGVIIKDGKKYISNKSHKSMYTILQDLSKLKHDEHRTTLVNQLKGHLSYCSYIDAKYKGQINKVMKNLSLNVDP